MLKAAHSPHSRWRSSSVSLVPGQMWVRLLARSCQNPPELSAGSGAQPDRVLERQGMRRPRSGSARSGQEAGISTLLMMWTVPFDALRLALITSALLT